MLKTEEKKEGLIVFQFAKRVTLDNYDNVRHCLAESIKKINKHFLRNDI